MAYSIKNTNNTEIVSIPNSVLSTTTFGIQIPGKNYTTYGESIGQTLLHILEHFACPNDGSGNPNPSNGAVNMATPVIGQMWFDTTHNKMRMFTAGSTWDVVSGSTPDSTPPSPAETGDIWFNTSSNQLYVYNGTVWTAISASGDITDAVYNQAFKVNVSGTGGLATGTGVPPTGGTNTDASGTWLNGVLTGIWSPSVVASPTYYYIELNDGSGDVTYFTFTPYNSQLEVGLNISGGITITGLLNGRDIAVDGTKLDGVEAGANLYVHPSDGVDPGAALTGATVFSDIEVNAAGHITGSSTRDLVVSDLNDVTITTNTSGEILKWDGTAWINNTLVEAGISAVTHNHTIDSLSNTTITTNTSGEILKWDGAAWVNNTLAEAGIIESGVFTYTLGGCTTSPTADAFYTKVGNMVTILFDPVSGTSNSTALQLSGIPSNLRPSDRTRGYVSLYNSGVSQMGIMDTQLASSDFIMYLVDPVTLSLQPSAFDASGSKGIRNASITYLLA